MNLGAIKRRLARLEQAADADLSRLSNANLDATIKMCLAQLRDSLIEEGGTPEQAEEEIAQMLLNAEIERLRAEVRAEGGDPDAMIEEFRLDRKAGKLL